MTTTHIFRRFHRKLLPQMTRSCKYLHTTIRALSTSCWLEDRASSWPGGSSHCPLSCALQSLHHPLIRPFAPRAFHLISHLPPIAGGRPLLGIHHPHPASARQNILEPLASLNLPPYRAGDEDEYVTTHRKRCLLEMLFLPPFRPCFQSTEEEEFSSQAEGNARK